MSEFIRVTQSGIPITINKNNIILICPCRKPNMENHCSLTIISNEKWQCEQILDESYEEVDEMLRLSINKK